MKKIISLLKTNLALLSNAAAMIGSTGITSALGFIYWWLAARQFSPAVVGLASAAISTMTLLGTFGILGLGTLLVGELPRQKQHKASLISTALIVAGGVSLVLGLLFALIAPRISAGWQEIGFDARNVLLFAIGVCLGAVTLVLDQALIGLLWGSLQLWRNALFAGGKLIALYLLGLLFSRATGMDVYTTWTIGNACSIIILFFIAVAKGLRPQRSSLFDFSFLRKLGFESMKHHTLNLALQAPALLLPIIVTLLLSTRENGWFYVAWNLSGIGNVVVSSMTMVLYAVSAAQPRLLARKLRLTLLLSLGACILINLAFLLGTRQILEIFGHTYAEQAAWSLRILSIESFAFIVKAHYVAVRRIHGRVAPTALATILTGLLEVGGSALGAHLGGLTGLSLGWLAAMGVETVIMTPTVFKALIPSAQSVDEIHTDVRTGELITSGALLEPVWSADTLIQPVWVADTLTLNAIVLPKKEVTTPLPARRTDSTAVPLYEDNTDVPTIRLANFFWYAEQETLELPRLK